MRKSMRQLVRKSGSLVMAAALAVGMTACSSQNNSQTTVAGTAAESQSSGAAGAESGASESAAESNAEASDAKAGDADQLEKKDCFPIPFSP